MADHEAEPKNDFPTPMINTRQDEPGSLDLEEVDVSKNGVQGDAVVTKGRASTFVTKLPRGVSGEQT